MSSLSTERKELFAQARAKGLSLTASAKEAGYANASAAVRGSELGRDVAVMERVTELRSKMDREVVRHAVADRDWVLTNLIEIAEEARLARDRPSATKALDLVGRELGLFVNRTMEVKSPLDALSAKELMAIVELIDSGKLDTSEANIATAETVLQLTAA